MSRSLPSLLSSVRFLLQSFPAFSDTSDDTRGVGENAPSAKERRDSQDPVDPPVSFNLQTRDLDRWDGGRRHEDRVVVTSGSSVVWCEVPGPSPRVWGLGATDGDVTVSDDSLGFTPVFVS